MQATTTGTSTFNLSLGSGARELLKWIALLAMTGDHVAKVVFGATCRWSANWGVSPSRCSRW